MKKIISYNLASLLILALVATSVHYLLLQDNCLDMSISAIIKQSNHLKLNQHLFVLGILPVYIAFVIFGTTILGFYLNSLLQQLISKSIKKPSGIQNRVVRG